jgi:serine/threonine protein kinase
MCQSRRGGGRSPVQEQTGRTRLPSGAEPLEARDPAVIGSYGLIGRLGEGGMGTVYLGRDTQNRLVAIKVIRPELAANQNFRARFRDEVSNAKRVASFCTAQVLEDGEEDGRPYLVTEYVDGRPLDEYIETQGALPSGTLHGVAVGVAAALTAIHAAGLVHRDLKPANVLLSVSGPRVIDFGIARVADETAQHTKAGFVVGSPGWMAPEQVLRGEISTAVDIFAWGTLVAFAGTGRRPYGTGPVLAMAARAERGEPDVTGLAGSLRALVLRALDPDPGRRPTAKQLLLSLVGGTETPAAGSGDQASAAQAAADQELSRTWRAQPPAMIPQPWTPSPSPPHGVPVGGAGYPQFSAPPPGPAPAPGPVAGHNAFGSVGSMPTQPPMAHPYPQPYPPARRKRRRALGCLYTFLGVLVASVAGLAIIGILTQPADGQRGLPAKDGQFTFLVNAPAKCGTEAEVRGITPSKGRLCQIAFSVENTGDKSRTLAPGYQELYDANDNYYAGAILLRGTADADSRVPPQLLTPGSRFSGVLLFDVPTGFQPTSVVLYDDSTSNGVRIPA